jgi:hypothetical protein
MDEMRRQSKRLLRVEGAVEDIPLRASQSVVLTQSTTAPIYSIAPPMPIVSPVAAAPTVAAAASVPVPAAAAAAAPARPSSPRVSIATLRDRLESEQRHSSKDQEADDAVVTAGRATQTESSAYVEEPDPRRPMLAQTLSLPIRGSAAAQPAAEVAPDASAVSGKQVLSSTALSRAAHARLSRHGFADALTKFDADDASRFEDSKHSGDSSEPPHFMRMSRAPPKAGTLTAVEATDPLSKHMFTFQFAAFRAVDSKAVSRHRAAEAGIEAPPQWQPRCVFFTFQFFSLPPVRTKRAFLFKDSRDEADDSQPFLLVEERVDPSGRVLPFPAVHLAVDTSLAGPDSADARRLAEYLSQRSMQIDVWDGDSKILVRCTHSRAPSHHYRLFS